KAIDLIRNGGIYGAITANKYLRSNYGKPIRMVLAKQVKLDTIIDFGDLPVFGDALTYPAIIIFKNIPIVAQNLVYSSINTLTFNSLDSILPGSSIIVNEEQLKNGQWDLGGDLSNAILKKIVSVSQRLGDIVGNKILRGLITGYNNAFVLDELTKHQL